VLALLRHKKTDKSMKVITRVHRYDLFNESQKGGWQPFRDYMDKYIDSIVFISQNGLDYYLTTWKKPLSKKYLLSRLGVINDYTRKQYRNNETKLILSCSNIIPFKRINLIIEGLALIEDINIHWVHIGDGIDFVKTKKMAIEFLDKKKNIVFTFAGRLPIEEVYDFYKKNFVDLFITTSSSEGLPVSMMEALSFGVPVIGTNVGGIPEAVGNWGILLPSTPSATDVSGAISRVFEKTEIEREELSIKSKAAWDNYFNFEKNSRQFIDILLQI
jgi:glycosyltransferase involved in cell wall biosynthesis